MDKIFDKEIYEYMENFGISRQEITKVQKEKLKSYAISVLMKVKLAIEQEDSEMIDYLIFQSRAGDGYESDNNTCIDFGGIINEEVSLDIEQLFKRIKLLNEGKYVARY